MATGTEWLEKLSWDDRGLVPVITQDRKSGKVLTLAWMNREALESTLAKGIAIYWSRSRQRLWQKGEASGHIQKVEEIRVDCDMDAILLLVEQTGGIACHTGRFSCFYMRPDHGKLIAVEPIIKSPELIYQDTNSNNHE